MAVTSMHLASIVGMIPSSLAKATGLVAENLLWLFSSTVFDPMETIALDALAPSSRIMISALSQSDRQ
ncbi:hypothetical protein [Xanthomonas sp. CFBP 8445]|uniref:hypothetical protein n=1 Tax=Xanthomonas sp. CFBP 8445 TaxID=2971236 RepID=UPI0021E03F0D|nr:hypothetical protein [Xanthomonas sp. CFBP 8445]UYC10599.1 hypothetical protein NUG21_12450 [Xanthomonas sp. CFBP 8445]